MAPPEGVEYRQYVDENDLPVIMKLVDEELSEPYSIFTYRYFIRQWPQLCYLAYAGGNAVGAIVCKMDTNIKGVYQGYIAMLVVLKPFRGRGIATELVTRSIHVTRDSGCHEVMLEAEVTNKGALALYGNLGFVRSKRLHRYYLNGVDAFRLKLRLPGPRGPGLPDGHRGEEGGCCVDGEDDTHNHHHHPHHHGDDHRPPSRHSHGLRDANDHSQCGSHRRGGGHEHADLLRHMQEGAHGPGRGDHAGHDHSSCGHSHDGHHHHHHH